MTISHEILRSNKAEKIYSIKQFIIQVNKINRTNKVLTKTLTHDKPDKYHKLPKTFTIVVANPKLCFFTWIDKQFTVFPLIGI